MSSTGRLILRLPRTNTAVTRKPPLRRLEQRRWINRPPAPRKRPWAARVPKDENKSLEDRVEKRQDRAPIPQPSTNAQPDPEPQVGRNTQLATVLAESDTSDLVTSVNIPYDAAGVLPKGHPALSILGQSSLVIQRQLEMMNVMLGFEQANRYIIMNGQGETLGYLAEQDHGIGRAMVRQVARTHRSFTTHIFDVNQREVLRIHRPFSYINSRIRIYDPIPEEGCGDGDLSTALQRTSAASAVDPNTTAHTSPLKLEEMRIIGEAQQQWAPLRRKYNLFTYRALEPASNDTTTRRIESGDKPTSDTTALTESKAPDTAIEAGMSQFAHISEPFLSWDFTLRDQESSTIGSVNRNFSGFAREIFTDTGVYALRMDSAAQSSVLESQDGTEVERYEREATGMTLDQRAVMLATAVSIDFDYFSRHSHAGSGGFMPFFWPMGGGAAEGAGAAGAGAAGAEAAGAGAVGAAGEVGAVGVGAAGRGIAGAGAGAAESGMVGAGTMAGYEAMQRGVYGGGGQGGVNDASPQAQPPSESEFSQGPEQMENQPGQDDVWGTGNDPWSDQTPPSGGGGGEGGGGGGWMDTISDFFSD
jgi:hypothetical protein